MALKPLEDVLNLGGSTGMLRGAISKGAERAVGTAKAAKSVVDRVGMKAVQSPAAMTALGGGAFQGHYTKKFDAEMAKPIPGKSTGMQPKLPDIGPGDPKKPLPKLPNMNGSGVHNEDEEMDEGGEQVENGPFGSMLSGAAIGAAGGYAMQPNLAGALKGSTIGIGAGLAHGIATDRVARKRKKKQSQFGTTNSTQENEMQLKPEDRAELVGNLTANCDCWNYEGSDEVLNAMPDEQLVAVYNQAASLEEILPVINQIAQDFGVDPNRVQLSDLPQTLIANAVAAFDGSGGGGGSDQRAGSGEDNPTGYINEGESEEEEENDEGDYEGDDQAEGDTVLEDPQTKGKGTVKNQRRKPMTTNQWLASAPPEVQVVVRNAMRRDAEEKEELIEAITANVNNPYSEEQLYSMTTEQLRPLSQLAATPRRQARPVTNGRNGSKPRNIVANYYGQQGAPVQNAAQEVPESELLSVPTIDWVQNAKELRDE